MSYVMGIAARGVLAIVVLLSPGVLASCHGTNYGTTTSLAAGRASVVDLSSSSAVDPTSSFTYSFAKTVDDDTVTTATFFMNQVESASISSNKAAYDSSSCSATSAASAVRASVTCESAWDCTLDPEEALAGGAVFRICLMRGSGDTGIMHFDGSAFEGFVAEFTTSASQTTPEPEPEPEPDDSCDATTECSTGEMCFFGSCRAYAELGYDTSMTCGSGGGQDCVDQAGGGNWGCVPIHLTTADACTEENYCLNLDEYLNADGIPSDSATCAASDGTWANTNTALGYGCVSNELVECFSERNDGDDEDDDEVTPLTLGLGQMEINLEAGNNGAVYYMSFSPADGQGVSTLVSLENVVSTAAIGVYAQEGEGGNMGICSNTVTYAETEHQCTYFEADYESYYTEIFSVEVAGTATARLVDGNVCDCEE